MADLEGAVVNAWEVRHDADGWYSVERGTKREGTLECAALGINDYGVACVVEAALNLRDGTVE